jgi:hypothetical protein
MNHSSPNDDNLDEIGDWSVDKLNILRAYSEQYSVILQNQTNTKGAQQFHFGYISTFHSICETACGYSVGKAYEP